MRSGWSALVAVTFLIFSPGTVEALNTVSVGNPVAPRPLPLDQCSTPGIGFCSGNYLQDESISFDLAMSFDDATVGGAINIVFDPAILKLDQIIFDAALPDDDTFQCPTAGVPGSVPCPSDATFVSWGNFNGLTGDHRVAQLFFTAIGIGESRVGVTQNRPFSSLVGSALTVGFEGGAVTVVPEPSTALLLALGLAGLPSFRARSRRAARRS